MGQRTAHYLHIGKTAGNAVKDALASQAEAGRYRLVLHKHPTTIADVPPADLVFFAVRDPIDRFVSGFYSRQRKGRPRNDVEWSEGEAAAFGRFKTPDELGQALSSPDTDERAAAVDAMRDIAHVRDPQRRWLGGIEGLRANEPRILMVLRQDRLDSDFAALTRLLEVDAELPEGDVEAHRNPAWVDKTINPPAEANLRDWYADDYRFVAACLDLRRWLVAS